MSEDNIYIRGWGAVNTLGWSGASCAQKLLSGNVKIASPCQSAHLLNRNFNAFEVAYNGSPLDKALAMLDSALKEAFARAGLTPAEIEESALLVGTTSGFFVRNEFEFTESVRLHPHRESPDIICRSRGPGETADIIADRFGIRGPLLTLSIACVSSSHALVVAARLLKNEEIRRAIIVGFEPLLNLTMQGFASLLLYDTEQCRPFCATRSGMQIGEAASCVILEKGRRSIAADNQYLYAGGYLFNDNNSLTSAGVDGEQVRDTVLKTLEAARITSDDVIAIKAHGTGTMDNDLSEGRGLVKVFGNKLPPVVSLKGAIGHSLGAAGAVETSLWLSCLEEGKLPVSYGFSQIDPEIGFAPSQEVLPAPKGFYLFTFFGFGGTYTGLVIRKT